MQLQAYGYHDVMPLAANTTSGFDVFTVLLWSAALIVLLVIGMAFALRLKRRLKAEDDPAAVPAAGFTLSDLRQMHRAGQLTEEEFTKAKEKIVAAAQKAAERASPKGETSPPRDSIDAIRARRLAREAQQLPPEQPDDANGA